MSTLRCLLLLTCCRNLSNKITDTVTFVFACINFLIIQLNVIIIS